MSNPEASLEAMNQMIKALTNMNSAEEELARTLKTECAAVGDVWQDKHYAELEGVVNQIVADLGKNYAEISEAISRVQILKRALEDYLSM